MDVVDRPDLDLRDDVREFVTSRRAKVTPQQVGLPAGRNRRVPDFAAPRWRHWPA